eukprot:CAMPEP_0183757008 /NCGR_PEP_ID=MMETSP0739-20130205/5436_1 /TAXON_ID=385413 /ORGANISM="Thalassiosira miniscula, Strain CCMP1093" /LENGTH=187 /DNA_ID=CAMNT_0025994335 /DNA_START=527 /DNA_END=1090 /DNA_ORIENTATION=-
MEFEPCRSTRYSQSRDLQMTVSTIRLNAERKCPKISDANPNEAQTRPRATDQTNRYTDKTGRYNFYIFDGTNQDKTSPWAQFIDPDEESDNEPELDKWEEDGNPRIRTINELDFCSPTRKCNSVSCVTKPGGEVELQSFSSMRKWKSTPCTINCDEKVADDITCNSESATDGAEGVSERSSGLRSVT